MSDPLTTQLQSTGTVPPTKRMKLDSVTDGTDLFLQDLPDDLLVTTNLDLPSLDGPSGPDLSGIAAGLASSQPQQLPGLHSTPPPSVTLSSQTRSVAPNASPMAQPLSQKSPATGGTPSSSSSTPPQSGGPALLNNTSPHVGGGGGGGGGMNNTSITGGAPPNATVVSTTADPTPALPSVSAASSPYPTPPSSVSPAMGTPPRMPSSSPYNSYPVGATGGMSSSAPMMNSQMNHGAMMQQQQQQPGMGGYGLRHPAASPGMGMTGQMMHNPNMISGHPRMIQMRPQRPAMMPGVHGGQSMMAGHHQQIHHSHMAMRAGQQIAPGGMGMAGGGMVQPGGAMHMNPNIMAYDRSRLMMAKQSMQHPRLPHPGMVPHRPQQNVMIGGHHHHHQYIDSSGYQSHMRTGYPMVHGQNTVPHSHPSHPGGPPQMLASQPPHMMPTINHSPQPIPPPPQPQPARPPSEGNTLPGQLGPSQTASPQLQIATPPQSQGPPPQPQATPPGQPTAANALSTQQQTPPTSRPATPQQQQQQQQQQLQHQLNAPPTSAPLQRGSPVGTATTQQQTAGQQQQPIPSPAPSQQQQQPVLPMQQQQQQQQNPSTQPAAVGQTQPSQPLSQSSTMLPPPPPPSGAQGQSQSTPSSLPPPLPSSSLSLTSDSLQYLSGTVGGGRGGGGGVAPGTQQQPQQQQMAPTPPHHPNVSGINAFGAPPSSVGAMVGGAGGGALGGPNQQAATDPEKRKLIQQQLVLLLHAHKCQRREREHSMGGGEYQPCTLPHCHTMKKVLDHMTECQAGRQCTYAHCASSRQIISHWKNCRKADCSVCQPLRITALPQNQALRPNMPQQGGGGGGGVNPPYSQPPGGSPQMLSSIQQQMRPLGPGGAPPNHTIRHHDSMMPPGSRPVSLESMFDPSGLGDMGGIDITSQSRVPFPVSIPNIPNQQTQPWHQSVQPELRQHLVRKLVETIFPIQNPNALQDQRVSSLITYAMKVEKAMFETATSREAYYQLLAEKIYRIRKELEERKRMRMEIDRRRPEGGQVNSNIPNGGDGLGPGFFGSSSSGSTNQTHPMAPSPFSSQSPFPGTKPHSQSPFPGHTNSPGAPSSVAADGNPSSLPPTDFLTATEDKKDGIPLHTTSSAGTKNLSPSSMAQPPSLPDLENIKTEVKSELKSPPPSSHPPWSRPEAPPTSQPATPSDQKPIPSVSRDPVSSVKSRREGDLPPDSIPPSLPPSVTPATPTKPMDTSTTTPISSSSSKAKVVPDPTLKKVFTREELLSVLLPVLEQVYKQEPEACPFWDPVDPTRLGIPDYFDIIKNPMDLRTIRNKLEEGHYTNPWEFCSDMRLMFDNAWIYNKKTSRVFKYCTKLAEVFDDCINPAMIKLGYCCGGRHTFHPQVLYCYGKSLCTIARDSIYFSYQNRYIYCQKCFSELPGTTVAVGDDPANTSEIAKSMFLEKKNDHVDYEPMVKCIHCGRGYHSICILHHPAIWPEGYQCDNCLKIKGTTRKDNKFCARRLPTNKLSTFLEERVNMFLRNSDSGSEIIIRTVSSFDKTLDTRSLMKDRFPGEFPEQFPYRTKALFVFEEIDGCEVCFFGLHVQEYGSDCEAPNTRRVYISYLDSIHFFRPKHLRTLVYHEILIGYLQFCKQNGFMTAHIWACPPSEGDDYIFHCHPPEQKIPKPKRLVEWYRKMLDRGKADNVVYDYRDIFKHCTEESVTSVTEIPYFEGDFWPNIIEDTIKELDQEEKEREASEAATVEGRGSKKAGKRGANKKGSKKASGTRSKSGKAGGVMMRGDDLSQKIYATMDKHKEVFFVVLLQPPAVCSSPIAGTRDPDQLIPCDLMDGRDAFLTLARERHWEFSSLRRAKASSQAMLYELHNQGTSFIYSCNSCGRSVETRYHCRECDDFDLCLTCYETTKHEHPMERLGLGIDSEDQEPAAQQDPQARRNASLQRAAESLKHASQCRNPQCKIPSCITFKRILRHAQTCRSRNSSTQCQTCKQLIFLVFTHAKTCKDNNCPLGGMCKKMKHNLQETRAQERRRSNLLMQQRIRNMQGMSLAASNSNGSSDSPATSNTSPTTNKAPPPTPPQKGSPAISSPAGPRSVGKGGPRTPVGERTGGKGAHSKMMGSTASKPDRVMPAPNVTVSQMSMPGEAIIQRVTQTPMVVQEQHDVHNNMMTSSMYRPRLQQKMDVTGGGPGGGGGGGGVMTGGDISHQSMYGGPRQSHMSMITMRPSPQPHPSSYSQSHPQLMRAAPAQQYSPYRTSTYPQSVHHLVSPSHSQVYSQQQTHPSPQLSQMLRQRVPTVQTYQTPPSAYPQMGHQHMGPPPQYRQPQPATYNPHMMSHPHHHQQMQGPMSQGVGMPMAAGHAHQFGPTHQMDMGVHGDPNFAYNGGQQQPQQQQQQQQQQTTYQLNSNNNSSNLSSQATTFLTPAEKLSSLSELL